MGKAGCLGVAAGVMWLELLTRRVELQLSDCPEADMGDVFWEPDRSLNIVLSI